MRKILITGACGQLGQAIIQAARGRGLLCCPTDRAELDITDASAVEDFVSEGDFDAIVNCAAYTDVERAEEDPQAADAINRLAVAHLARAAQRKGILLVHVSTDYVFGGKGNTPFDEQAPTCPLGVYGRTKLAGEQEVLASGCRHLIFRTAWLYSETGRNFVRTMLHLTTSREELSVVFDQAGTPTYAGDLADAIVRILASGADRGCEGIYHYTDQGVCSWYDLAVETAAAAGHTGCTIRPCRSGEYPSKVERPAYSVLDKSKFLRTFGIGIPHWRESLVRCVENLEKTENP